MKGKSKRKAITIMILSSVNSPTKTMKMRSYLTLGLFKTLFEKERLLSGIIMRPTKDKFRKSSSKRKGKYKYKTMIAWYSGTCQRPVNWIEP